VEKRMAKTFNKVIHTENIFAIGDTYSTDMEFPGHPQVAGCNSARN
jgi:NADH dehydrogenase FAD-containing subunit